MTGGNCAVCRIVGLLVGIGALNWGLIAFFGLDWGLGPMTAPAKAVYGVIGLAGLLKLISLVKVCPCCKGKSCDTKK